MKLSYNGFELSNFGEVSVSQTREMEGAPEQPQRAKVTLAVRVDVFQRTYEENRQVFAQAQAALTLPNAQLVWINDATGTVYVNQTATLTADGLPEEWGQYHQPFDLSFSYYEQTPGGASNNVPLTFTKTGSGAPLTFDVVNKWAHAASVERFSTLRKHRKETHATIRAEGQYFGDTTQPLATRRAALAAQAVAFNNGMNAADGRLSFGDGGSVFAQTVRIADWNCEVNQMINAIEWSFTATYTLFPDETAYATAEYTASEKDDFNGQLVLAVAGKIQAPDEASAKTKLDLVLAAVIASRAYAAGQRLDFESAAAAISANADGDAFIELTFNATYRKWKTSNLTASLKPADDAVVLGNVNRWRDTVTSERFNPLRSQRERTTCGIEAAGTLAGSLTMTLPDRRNALLAQQRALKAAAATADVALTYGDFTQVVRISQFTAEINQAETGIEWSFTATYTLFPAESSYATAEYAANEKDDFNGQLLLAVTGQIQAQDEAAAKTKRDAILSLIITGSGYDAGQKLTLESTASTVDANGDGVTFTQLTFSATYRKWKDTNQPATFKGATLTARALGNVTRWRDQVTTERFDPMRKQRVRTACALEAAGTLIAAEPSPSAPMSVTDRRAALLVLQRQLKAEVNIAEGTLVFGDFSQAVRVGNFTAEINQAETGIEWSLTATYTLFPAEANYATAQYETAERDDNTGQLVLGLNGRIQAQSAAAAQTKLAALLAAAIIGAGYTAGQQLGQESSANTIDANGDGVTFTELTFNYSYRRWKPTNQKATILNAAGVAVPFGNVNRWRDSVSATRFNPLRSHRERTTCGLEAAGTLAGDMALSLTARRTQLLGLQRKLKAAVNQKECTLAYGDFTQVVRVTEFAAEINQAETGIEWTLSATYTLFPDETNYATAEFTVAERDDMNGQVTLSLSGRIQSPDEASATAKLAAIVAAVTGQRGYNLGQQLGSETAPANVSANADGDTFTELAFTVTWRKWKTTNQRAVFTRTGGGAPVPFGNVRTWREDYQATRFNSQRSQRRQATGRVDAAGTFSVDQTLSLADRRTALLALQRAMIAEVNSADGTLAYNDWSQIVRVEDFQAEINQAETGIDWTLAASYSRFPAEGGYATAEFACQQSKDVESGDEFFTFSGRISAPTGQAARAKLATLRTAVLATYGWAVNQRLSEESTVSAVDANGDQTVNIAEGLEAPDATQTITALDLNFNERYRRRITGTLVSSTLTRSDVSDLTSQTMMSTYAGSVTASGPTPDAAYATALARAQALGANRETAIDSTTQLRRSSLVQESRWTRGDGPTEFLRLNFSYEYVSKLAAGQAFIELTTTITQDTFGVDTETCSGTILARDAATASALYASQVRALYTSRLVTSETAGNAQQILQRGAGFAALNVKLDFSLSAFSPKATGKVAWSYAIEVSRDMLTLDMATVVRGSCYAVNRPAADAGLSVLLASLNLGANVRSQRNEAREGVFTVGGSDLDVMLRLDFDEEFSGRVTGQTGLNSMSVTESVVYSGTRNVVQPLPFNTDGSGGVSIVQPGGVEAGSRTVSGTVTAGTLATALAWAYKQRALLTGDQNGNHYPQPERIEISYEFVPRIDGVAQGSTANVKLHRVAFTFSEILPLYPPPS